MPPPSPAALPVRLGRVEMSYAPEEDEGRSVAAQECELRDRSAGDLRRHEADIVF